LCSYLHSVQFNNFYRHTFTPPEPHPNNHRQISTEEQIIYKTLTTKIYQTLPRERLPFNRIILRFNPRVQFQQTSTTTSLYLQENSATVIYTKTTAEPFDELNFYLLILNCIHLYYILSFIYLIVTEGIPTENLPWYFKLLST